MIEAEELSPEKKLEWIDGLRRAQAVRILFDVATIEELDETLKSAIEIALVQTSKSQEFCVDQ